MGNSLDALKEGLCGEAHHGRKLILFKSSQNWCTGAFEHAEQEYQLYFSMRTTKTQLKSNTVLVRMRKFLLNFNSHAEIFEVAIMFERF